VAGHADAAKGEKRGSEWFGLQACRIVISNEKGDLLREYRLRWKVETLFQALKGRGFDLERPPL
jgi:hypothetical protein